jgi:hypothetical protein
MDPFQGPKILCIHGISECQWRWWATTTYLGAVQLLLQAACSALCLRQLELQAADLGL